MIQSPAILRINQANEEQDLDEDGDGAAGVVDGDGDRAQRHLGPRRVVHVLPENDLHLVSVIFFASTGL